MSFLDRFLSDKKEEKSNYTGAKIRKLRIRKDIPAADLGNAAGVNDTAIRNYEVGYRQITSEKLSLIAQKLNVPVESLIDRQINSYADVIHILFELSDAYEFIPVMLPQEPKYAILTKDETVIQALQAWYEKRREWETGIITQVQYQDWKDSFPLLCEEEAPAEVAEATESLYTDFERILGLKSALETIDMIVDSKVNEALECVKSKDYKMARKRLEELQSTVHTVSQMDIKKFG